MKGLHQLVEHNDAEKLPIILNASRVLEHTINHLKTPKIQEALKTLPATIRLEQTKQEFPNLPPGQLLIITMIESGQLIPKLEELNTQMKTLVTSIERKEKTWAQEADRGIKPPPKGPRQIT